MEFAIATAIGALVAAGVWMLLRARTFEVVLGLTLISYAVNLLIFSMGRLAVGKPPVLDAAADPATYTLANHADPLPQALVLTAIVIGFATTAVLLVVAIRNRGDNGSDHVDGREPVDGDAPAGHSAAPVSSSPRRRGSSDVEPAAADALDPRLRGDDERESGQADGSSEPRP